jgi:hypothetical protein
LSGWRGLNYDILNGLSFGPAGAMTTDSTNTAGIRLGAVIGIFSVSPTRAGWFPIGSETSVVVTGGSGHLYVAVNDTPCPKRWKAILAW